MGISKISIPFLLYLKLINENDVSHRLVDSTHSYERSLAPFKTNVHLFTVVAHKFVVKHIHIA